jgi:hypothetical protein
VLAAGCERDRRGALAGYGEPLRVQLEEFVAACRSGAPTLTGPDHLLAVTAVLEAAEYSAALGGLPYRLAPGAPELTTPGSPLSAVHEFAAEEV